MKGLFLRIIVSFILLLWAIDMIFPWQKIIRSEENRYQTVQSRGTLVVGTINNPLYYFVGSEGESGLEYELAKSFADYLGVKLEIEVFDNPNAVLGALENNR
ncbi:MAG: lytic transglycosylase F, partial [Rodentibacter sp.]